MSKSHGNQSTSCNTTLSIRSNPPAYMSVAEGALFIGASERKLRASIANHEVKHVRFGTRIILRRQDLDAFLKEMVT